jgi:hypothetical protein
MTIGILSLGRSGLDGDVLTFHIAQFADLEDAGALLGEYQQVQQQVKDTKATLEYLDKADHQEVMAAADAAQLEATWSDWMAQADKYPGVARQTLRKVLASPIAVRPSGKGTWTFAGFSKYSEIIKGGIGKDGS